MPEFTWAPSYQIELDEEPRVLRYAFGDGYEARQADGLNNRPRKWSLTFNRPKAQADAILAFLRTRNGVEAFDWTDPDGNAGRWVARSWKSIPTGPNTRTVTVTFDEVFVA